jgi:serine/threonine protein kinase
MRMGENHNGKIDGNSIDMSDFMIRSKAKIQKECDIYSIGAIMFRLLLDAPPTKEVNEYISGKNLDNESPNNNVFKVPYFCEDFIMSNELCQILVSLLHKKPSHRYPDIEKVRNDLLQLRKNIFETP